MKTTTIIVAILFSTALKSQIIFNGKIEQTFVWSDNAWTSRDSALGEIRKIEIDAKKEKLTLTMGSKILIFNINDEIKLDPLTTLVKVSAADDNHYPIIFEYAPFGTEAALYYHWNSSENNFMKSELLFMTY
ncbi:MAG: hypothetical protein KA163_07120 [Bacteroidia bacterium]|nr:hypothetical protein [Bacteroidia bacterium]